MFSSTYVEQMGGEQFLLQTFIVFDCIFNLFQSLYLSIRFIWQFSGYIRSLVQA